MTVSLLMRTLIIKRRIIVKIIVNERLECNSRSVRSIKLSLSVPITIIELYPLFVTCFIAPSPIVKPKLQSLVFNSLLVKVLSQGFPITIKLWFNKLGVSNQILI